MKEASTMTTETAEMMTTVAGSSSDRTTAASFPHNFTVGNWTASQGDLEFIQRLMVARNVIVPLFVAVGLVGNTLSLLVFTRGRFKQMSSSKYLAALACTDNVFLSTLLLTWLHDFMPVITSATACKVLVFLSYTSSYLSVCFVVCFTTERYVAVCHPLHAQYILGKVPRMVVMLMLVGSAVALYSCSLWTTTAQMIPTGGGGGRPAASEGGEETDYGESQGNAGGNNNDDSGDGEPGVRCISDLRFLHVLKALTWTDTALTMVLPSTLLVVMNAFIAVAVCRSYAMRGFSHYLHPSRQPHRVKASAAVEEESGKVEKRSRTKRSAADGGSHYHRCGSSRITSSSGDLSEQHTSAHVASSSNFQAVRPARVSTFLDGGHHGNKSSHSASGDGDDGGAAGSSVHCLLLDRHHQQHCCNTNNNNHPRHHNNNNISSSRVNATTSRNNNNYKNINGSDDNDIDDSGDNDINSISNCRRHLQQQQHHNGTVSNNRGTIGSSSSSSSSTIIPSAQATRSPTTSPLRAVHKKRLCRPRAEGRKEGNWVTRRLGQAGGSRGPALLSRFQLRTTRTLLLVSISFLVLSLPSYVLRLRQLLSVSGGGQPTLQEVLVQEVAQLAYYSTYALNFFLYTIYGRHFQQALQDLGARLKHLFKANCAHWTPLRPRESRTNDTTGSIYQQGGQPRGGGAARHSTFLNQNSRLTFI